MKENVIIYTICIIAAAVFSGLETAVISIDKLFIRKLQQRNDIKRHKLRIMNKLIMQKDILIISLLIGTNIAIISSASFGTKILHDIIGKNRGSDIYFFLLSTFILTFTALLIADILPKTIFRAKALTLIIRFAYFLDFIYFIFYPIAYMINKIVAPFLKSTKTSVFVSRNELYNLAKAATSTGELGNTELNYIKSILEFNKIRAKEILIPAVDMKAIPDTSTLQDAVKIMKKNNFEYVSVFNERFDNISGFILLKDIVICDKAENIKSIIHKPIFAPYSMPIDEILHTMHIHEIPVIYVVNEYGGIMGYVNFDVIIEEISTDLAEEETQKMIKKVSDNNYIIDADTDLDDIEEVLKIKLPRGDYETLNGLIVYSMEKIPKIGEKFIYKNLEFEIIEATQKCTEKIRVKIYKKN